MTEPEFMHFSLKFVAATGSASDKSEASPSNNLVLLRLSEAACPTW